MLLWFLLFLLVVAISFVLAYQSMKDFQDNPESLKADYGLFLIRNPSQLTVELLKTLHDQVAAEGLIVSIERLFKGQESALAIFGPRQLLLSFSSLNLLELEDYTEVDKEQIQAWEVGIKNKTALESADFQLFDNLPELKSDELFWWQIALRPMPQNFMAGKSKESINSFQGQIRAVFFSARPERRHQLGTDLQNLAPGILAKIPKPFTSSQILKLYQQRSLSAGKNETQILSSKEIIGLIRL